MLVLFSPPPSLTPYVVQSIKEIGYENLSIYYAGES